MIDTNSQREFFFEAAVTPSTGFNFEKYILPDFFIFRYFKSLISTDMEFSH